MQVFERQLDGFLRSGQVKMSFPTHLNAFQRMLIHELCTARGLGHTSEGDGHERRLIVINANALEKPVSSTKDAAPDSTQTAQSDSNAEASATQGICLSGSGPTPLPPTKQQKKAKKSKAVATDLEVDESSELAVAGPGRFAGLTLDDPKGVAKGKAAPVRTPAPAPAASADAPPLQAATTPAEPMRLCSLCKANVPDANSQIHTIRCEREHRAAAATAAAASSVSKAGPARQASASKSQAASGSSRTAAAKPERPPTRDEKIISAVVNEDKLLDRLAASVRMCQVRRLPRLFYCVE
jgi:hypothetical protein